MIGLAAAGTARGAMGAPVDLAEIPDLERFKSYAEVCHNARDTAEGLLAVKTAYALRLERQITEVEQKLGITQRALDALQPTKGVKKK
jgi:hypothetical protein